MVLDLRKQALAASVLKADLVGYAIAASSPRSCIAAKQHHMPFWAGLASIRALHNYRKLQWEVYECNYCSSLCPPLQSEFMGVILLQGPFLLYSLDILFDQFCSMFSLVSAKGKLVKS